MADPIGVIYDDEPATTPPGVVYDEAPSQDNSFSALPGKIGQNFLGAGTDVLKMLASLIGPTGGAMGGAALGALTGPAAPIAIPLLAGGGSYLGGKANQALGLTEGGTVEDLLNAIIPAIPSGGIAALKGLFTPAKVILASEKGAASKIVAEDILAQARDRLIGGSSPEGPIQPLSERIRPTTPADYSFMDKAPVMPEIPLTITTKLSNELVAKMEGVPKAAQPAKIPKLTSELGAGKPKTALDEYIEALNAPSSPTMRPQPGDIQSTIAGRSPENTARAALIQLQSDLAASGGTMPLDKVQQTLQGIGHIANTTTDERVIGLANRLYKVMMDDVRASGPAGAQFAKAQSIVYQGRAANRVADIVTKYGTQLEAGNTGRIKFDTGSISNAIKSEKWLSEALPASEWKKIQQTLDEVFKAHQGLESLPPIVAPNALKYKPGNMLTQHPFVAGSLATGVGAMMGGLPHAGLYALGAGTALVYPRMIFWASMKPAGREFIRNLYSHSAPSMNDISQFTALANFLRSQGDPNAPIQ